MTEAKAEQAMRTGADETGTIWICAATDPTRRALQHAAEAERIPCVTIEDADDLARRLKTETPAALLVEHTPPTIYASDMLEVLQAAHTPGDREITTVVIAQPEAADRLNRPGVSEVLEAPLGEDFLRARLRGWATHTPVRWARGATPANEGERLAALQALGVLDTPREERFERLTRIASTALGVPIALVSLIDQERQWFKARVGLDVAETPRDLAFCAHAAASARELIVPDASADDRFADNPLVSGPLGIRFYAGMPLCPDAGPCIGTLCVIDQRPRAIEERELTLLRDLRDLVLRELSLPPESASP